MADVVPVPHEGKPLSFQRTEMFLHRQKISDRLTRVFEVRERIDNRNACTLRKLDKTSVGKCADDDAGNPTLEVFGDVVDGFSLAETDIGLCQENRVTAELVDCNVERDVRAERLFFEDHCDRFSLQRAEEQLGLLLHLRGKVQNLP
jgi:hypothetical protein